jgi:hypothetical protein
VNANYKMPKLHYFNPLRTEYYVSGRSELLHDNLSVGSILLGYAIESILKETLIRFGNNKPKLQHSHNLKLLFQSCLDKGAFNKIQVPDDFLDFSNSVFQMRYPSVAISETLKAYDRNNAISLTKEYLFSYDEFFQQLDEELFQITQDAYSSTILRIFASLSKEKRQFGLYFNVPALKNYDKYKERVKKYFTSNKEAISLLENEPNFFWTDGYNYNIYAGFEFYKTQTPLANFKFPGKVVRDKTGRITHLVFS